ncbi:hypothetical protein [Kineothrix sedimenti]|uniref:Uncharacterized protein n=1 Tax=Kineothrix sedimenti TaxID=3123317 RepID=A0ABZ3ERM5_9FIRM
MKSTKNKSIPTTPDGSWEGTQPKQSFKTPGTLTTDLQYDDYPDSSPLPNKEEEEGPRED